jgi:hypothetical protein
VISIPTSEEPDFLKLPGIKLRKLTYSTGGKEIPSERYIVKEEDHIISWNSDANPPPREPIVWFEGKENLVTDRWKPFAIR